MNNNQLDLAGAALSEYIKAYVAAKIAESWEGSRPVEEWESIEREAEETKKTLESFAKDVLGLEVVL